MIVDITETNCKILTGLDLEDLLGITGIYGIHDKEYISKVVRTKRPHFLATYSDETAYIEFTTFLVKELTVIIDFYHKSIINKLFISKKDVAGLSFPRLHSQVYYAKKAKFQIIKLTAWGSHKTSKKWNGYIVWGKYGFLMAIGEQRDKFLNEMIKNNRPERLLYDLLKSKSGVELWELIGFYWYGEFDLSNDSKSMEIFNEEIKRGRKTRFY